VFDRDGRLICCLSLRDIKRRRRDTTIGARMRQTLAVAARAVTHGVGSAHLVDGHRLHALLLEVLASASGGTAVLPDTDFSFPAGTRHEPR
jgi:acetylglutamate kinase